MNEKAYATLFYLDNILLSTTYCKTLQEALSLKREKDGETNYLRQVNEYDRDLKVEVIEVDVWEYPFSPDKHIIQSMGKKVHFHESL